MDSMVIRIRNCCQPLAVCCFNGTLFEEKMASELTDSPTEFDQHVWGNVTDI